MNPDEPFAMPVKMSATDRVVVLVVVAAVCATILAATVIQEETARTRLRAAEVDLEAWQLRLEATEKAAARLECACNRARGQKKRRG